MSPSDALPEIPANLRYLQSHEWARLDSPAEAVIGISAYAVQEMGDIVHLELPEAGATLKQRDSFGVIDSVKAAFDLYAPLSGEVIAVNSAALADPSIIGREPYKGGWLLRIRPANAAQETAGTLDAAAYKRFLESDSGSH